MIRHSPCEFYLKYLVVHPERYTVEYIQESCERKQLDFLNEAYVEYLRTRCLPPNPFYPSDPLHVRSQRFLFKEKLQQLFLPDDDMKITLRMVEHARAKEFVEAMILSGAPLDRIADALGPHRGFPATPKSVEYFKHFFWNIDLVDSTELRALLQLRAPVADHVPEKQKKSAGVLNKAFKDDPRVVAANLPNHPLVAMMSQIRMGLMPRNLDLAGLIETTRTLATMRSLEATMLGGPFDSKKALEFSLVAKNMGEMLGTVVKPDEKLREELATIALKTEEGPVPYINELSAGSHTVELSPIKALRHEPSGEQSAGDDSPED
jgi:hypothetical protein